MTYNLNNVKEMKVTEEFLTLHENIRHCQITNYNYTKNCGQTSE